VTANDLISGLANRLPLLARGRRFSSLLALFPRLKDGMNIVNLPSPVRLQYRETAASELAVLSRADRQARRLPFAGQTSSLRVWGMALAVACAITGTFIARADPRVVPPVKEWRENGGQVVLKSPVRIDAADRLTAQLLADELELHGAQGLLGKGKGGPILVGLAGERTVAGELAAAGLSNAVPQQPESYLISIGPRGALVTARDETGLFYGAQTLRQLMRPVAGGVSLAGGVIRDWPEMGLRGLSVDLSLSAVPTEEHLRQIINTCAEYKLNLVSLYLENLVAFPSTPLLAPKGAELGPDELRRLVVFAAQRHVMLMPQQQTFGHLHYLLRQELYAHLAEVPHNSTLAAGDPAVYQWIEGVADELTAIFPAPLFHAGGDETWDLGKGVNHEAALADGGVGKLWAAHMSRVAGILRGHGRRTLFWGDIPLKTPAIIPQLPRDMIAATWTYEPDDHFADYITPYRKVGLDVLVCPSVNNWSKPAPDFDKAVTNTGRFVAEGKRQGALGMLNTVWFDDGESLFDMVWYPVLYSAAASWQGANVERDAFDAAYDWAFHRAEGGAMAAAIRKLGEVHQAARRAGLTDAADEYVWLNPYKGRGPGIYAKLAPQAPAMRRAAEEALTLILRNRARCRLHTNELDFLEFAARRMDWLGMKVEFAGEIAAKYRDARAHASESERVNYAFMNLIFLPSRISDLRDAAGELKQEYRRLWLSTSQPYLLNGMLALYDRELLYWLDMKERLADAQASCHKNHTLPDPATLGLSEP
jgi:hypothetical protein